jgi:hypothetical protein
MGKQRWGVAQVMPKKTALARMNPRRKLTTTRRMDASSGGGF